MKLKVSKDIKELLELLNKRRVDYLVCGGHAVAFYGYPRLTSDFDILVRPNADNARRVMAALDDFGFGSAGIPIESFSRPGSAVTLGAQPNQVDLLTSLGPRPVERAFDNPTAGDIEGVPTRFIGLDELIATKRAANRPKDIADALELEKNRKMAKRKRYALLDRDGTVIVEKDYLSDPAGVALLPGVIEGLKALAEAGWRLIVVTNQSGVGRGYYSLDAMKSVNARVIELLAAEGVAVDGVYYCPHAPEENCDCRKPKTGMIDQAIREHRFEPKESVVIGDKPCDIELGRAVGALTVFVRTGHGAEYAETEMGGPDIVADNLLDAARAILKRE